MALDLTGINNKNEYYTNHYISTIFEKSVKDRVKKWSEEGKEQRSPVALLSDVARSYGQAYERYNGASESMKRSVVLEIAERYLCALGYGAAVPEICQLDRNYELPVYHSVAKPGGNPALWILLVSTSNPRARDEEDSSILEGNVFDASVAEEGAGGSLYDKSVTNEKTCEDVVNEAFFGEIDNPPRFIMLIGMKSMALLDRNKWNEKRYLEFDLEEIFARREHSTLQAMTVLLHKSSICPDAGSVVLDDFDEESRKNASGVSVNLKYALRECIELLGNEVLYYMKTADTAFDADSVDAGELTLECLRYMYRMLFVLFIESRPELGYAPMKDLSYCASYSLESLREIAEGVKADSGEIGDGYYVYETISGLYDMIYNGYPDEVKIKGLKENESIHDVFYVAPLKGHIFDPERTPMINGAKLRNGCMLRIIDKMSYAYDSASKRRVRISYSNLGINQLGSVYEALLSYRGFIAKEDLYEVKKAGEKINELDVGYFVTADELSQYSENERARYEYGKDKGKLRIYKKGTFIYRLAGREREKSASYYTPESLTKCLVKYALEELLKDKTADEILSLTICEPAMGSAAFINEAINQLAEAYIIKKEAETKTTIKADERLNELQKVKMFIADRNVYGIDLNPVAVELAEVSIWLNSIYEGGYVPWFGTQLVNGNSLIGARRQVYKAQYLTKDAARKWYDTEPERLPFDKERVTVKTGRTDDREIYHFLLGDPGMCSYGDKVVKGLCPENIKKIQAWNKEFNKPYSENDIENLLRLSASIDKLWKEHIKIRKQVKVMTRDKLSVFGNDDTGNDSHTSIRDKDNIYNEVCKTAEMENAGPYARLKLAMDYWCALWFWPIDKADLLPTRERFFLDMSLILEGNVNDIHDSGSSPIKHNVSGQMSLFPSEFEEQIQMVFDEVSELGVVDIPALKEKYQRISLAFDIAERNKFMHWELEFSDMFADRGGFDLIIGNPPWVLLWWQEQDLLSDSNPIFAIKNLSAPQTAEYRSKALSISSVLYSYLDEYESVSAQQNFLSSCQNYFILKGQKTNLYKCFLPQGWLFTNNYGVTAYVHPDGVYDDPAADILRERIYPRLRKHFMFINEKKLFADVDHHTIFSLNVYGKEGEISFDSITNLYDVSTISQCYDGNESSPIPKIKNEKGDWNIIGHP
ncbi:MAG: hypothetical protein LUD72_14440 [Bacteroidales bacterium]|nr:hypothetical protein [Bacteroidales bacterium]